jgi:NAD(P)-dependent dehydrogenase (short-subunit alcohol dehydrogenase family)
MMRLANKVAVVTAAGSGIGRASALLFAKEGAKVVVADIDPKGGEETVDLITKLGNEAMFVRADVAKVSHMENMIKTTVATYGKLNILFNHAGMPGPRGLEEVGESEWDHALGVLTKGGFFACKFAVPEIRKAGGGSMLFTSSVSGLGGSPNSPLYSLAKGGIIMLVKSLALLLADDGIRVNCIAPGLVDTPMLPQFFGLKSDSAGGNWKDISERALNLIPLKRFACPEDIAWAALFLSSDESSYITGTTLLVDGGFRAR